MKALYRCDFCEKTGTVEEIQEHEEKCLYNPKNKSCATCTYGRIRGAYLTVAGLTTPNFTCTYNKNTNSLSIIPVSGEPCEHYTQGNCQKVRLV